MVNLNAPPVLGNVPLEVFAPFVQPPATEHDPSAYANLEEYGASHPFLVKLAMHADISQADLDIALMRSKRIPPGHAHNLAGWHFDENDNWYATSNVLPTEYLTGDEEALATLLDALSVQGMTSAITNENRTAFAAEINALEDAELEALGFTIWSAPIPGDIVQMSRWHLHRPQINKTAHDVCRVIGLVRSYAYQR